MTNEEMAQVLDEAALGCFSMDRNGPMPEACKSGAADRNEVQMALQPMTTAPRDGSEVWLMRDGAILIKCRWVEHEYPLASWITVDEQIDGEYEDSHVDGWLDIDALVRDAERWDWLQSQIDPGKQRANNGYVEQTIRCIDNDTLRKSVDKEMNRG